MLKDQVFDILQKNFSKIKTDSDSVSYKLILDSDIHPSIKNYIKAELKILFSRDKAAIKKKSVFNYSSVKVEYLFHQIFDELIRTTTISSEELKNLLLQAISFNLSHLIKPNWSLKKLIFNDKKSINSSDFFFLIDYAYFYPYQKDVCVKYFKKNDYSSVESSKFEQILKKTDIKLFERYKREILLEFFNSTLEFINSFDSESLSIEIILSYLSDKNLNDDYNKIKLYLETNKTASLSRSEFENILLGNNTINNYEKSNEDGIKDNINIDDNNEQLDSEPLFETESDEEIPPVVKTDENINRNENLSLFEDEFEIEIEGEEELKTANQEMQQEKIETKVESNSQHKKKKRTAIEFMKFFNKKELQRIQENLFNSDSEDFILMIEKIISAPNHTEALSVLDEIVRLYKADESSKEVNLIKSAIQQFYNE